MLYWPFMQPIKCYNYPNYHYSNQLTAKNALLIGLYCLYLFITILKAVI